MKQNAIHEKITIKRTIKASLEQVFAAWADPDARAVWGPQSDGEGMEFSETDFRVGGKDVHRCGQKGDLCFLVKTIYHDIQQPSHLLFTERVSTDDSLLCVSLITAEFSEAGEATNLELTVQVASLVGEDMIAGNRGGWEAALNNLGAYLA